jgi:hypothetical protein
LEDTKQDSWSGGGNSGNDMNPILKAAVQGGMIPSCVGEINRSVGRQMRGMVIDNEK